jgi:hypothetical protein
MLSASAMAGLPFVLISTFYIVVFAAPLALLLLIMLLNKNYEVFTKPKALFYAIECLIIGLIIAFILTPDPYRVYLLLTTILLAIIGIAAEMTYVYYSGVDLSKNLVKVYPEPHSDHHTEPDH